MDRTSTRRSVRISLLASAAAVACLALSPSATAATGDEHGLPNGLVKTQTHTQVREITPIKAASATAASRISGQLNYSQQAQQQNQWCWAADGSSIEQSLGGSASQTQFCAAGKGGSGGYCPNQAAQIYEIVRGFQGTGFRAQDANGPIGFDSIKSQIDSGIPNLTGIYWTQGGGHAQVIYGYDASNQSIMIGDPWPSSQRYQTWDYSDYSGYNGQFQWNDTIVNIAKG